MLCTMEYKSWLFHSYKVVPLLPPNRVSLVLLRVWSEAVSHDLLWNRTFVHPPTTANEIASWPQMESTDLRIPCNGSQLSDPFEGNWHHHLPHTLPLAPHESATWGKHQSSSNILSKKINDFAAVHKDNWRMSLPNLESCVQVADLSQWNAYRRRYFHTACY